MNTPTLETLLTHIRACQICSGLPLGPAPLLQASEAAKVLIVGQAPGRVAHEARKPFADRSGVRLREWLGVEEATFYDPARIAIVPMGFCFPGTGKGGDFAPRPECAEAWRKPLLEKLTAVELTVVMGVHAQRWHLSRPAGTTLTDTVKQWREYWPKLVPLPHPSPRNQRWFKTNPFFERDLLPQLQARVSQLIT